MKFHEKNRGFDVPCIKFKRLLVGGKTTEKVHIINKAGAWAVGQLGSWAVGTDSLESHRLRWHPKYARDINIQ